jgi:hypothetical protein
MSIKAIRQDKAAFIGNDSSQEDGMGRDGLKWGGLKWGQIFAFNIWPARFVSFASDLSAAIRLRQRLVAALTVA